MANSLMELYGGGMARPSTNYQLGGRIPKYPLGGQIAASRRGREYQSEIRKLEEKQKAAAKRKRKSGFLGSIGSIAGGALGSLLAPITGGASIGIGAGLGRALGESSYGREDFSGGKYAQETRGELRDVEDDYREGIAERALVSGLQAAIMPGIFEKAGEAVSGAGKFVTGLGATGESALEAGTGLYSTAAAPLGIDVGLDGNILSQPVSGFGTGDKGFGLLGLEKNVPVPSGNLSGIFSQLSGAQGVGDAAQTVSAGLGAYAGSGAENMRLARALGLDLSGGQTVRSLYEGAGYGDWSGAAKKYSSLFGRTGGEVPMMPMGGLVDRQRQNTPIRPQMPNMPMRGGPPSPGMPIGPPRPNAPTGGGPSPNVPIGLPMPNAPIGGGGTDYTPDLSNTDLSGLQGGVFGDNTGGGTDYTPDLSNTDLSGLQNLGDTPIFGSDTDWSGLYDNTLGGVGSTTGTTGAGAGSTGYGTAIGSQSALNQMGMGDVANDPRLQKYLSDLPQFSQGYRQQFGDIQSGGRQALSQLYASQRNTGGGFEGAGSGAQAFGQQYSGLSGEQDRLRRGVVEGFQSDLLSGISDIEEKGEFEFGVGRESMPLAWQEANANTNTNTNPNPPPDSAGLYAGQEITQGGIKWQWNGGNWENIGIG